MSDHIDDMYKADDKLKSFIFNVVESGADKIQTTIDATDYVTKHKLDTGAETIAKLVEFIHGEYGTSYTSTDSQKQLTGKPKYFNRVDVSACIDPVARVRSSALDEIKKYPESMQWKDIPAENFLDAIQRHLNKIYEAGDIYAVDPETDCFHLDAIAWNHMVLEIKRTGREREL